MDLLPPWLFWTSAAAFLAVGLPTWWNVMRERQIAGLLRRAAAARGEQRDALILEAFRRAGRTPRRWAALARNATVRGLGTARATALTRLRELGGADDAARIEAAEAPAALPVGHPEEAAAAVERLIEAGAWDAAERRVAAALKRYPSHVSLRDMRARLDEARRSVASVDPR
jgi:hypothetical protein